MKRLYSLLLSIILSLTYAATARDFTYTYEGQTLTYTVIDEDAKTCMTKPGDFFVPGNNISGDVVIPDQAKDINGVVYTVTSIGKYSFSGCSTITSAELPTSLKIIETGAFIGSSLASIVIPPSVSEFGSNAFHLCYSLNSVYISNLEAWLKITRRSNPLEYGANIYLNDTIITNLVIPEGITKIESFAFQGCSSISSVTLSQTIDSINYHAFENCRNLHIIHIPKSVKFIDSFAFKNCNYLKEVYIEDLTSWCEINFISKESNPLQSEASLYLDTQVLVNLEIPSSISKIKPYTFTGCSSIKSVKFPDSTIEICENAFYNCRELSKLSIGTGVKSLGDYAFFECPQLSEINCSAIAPPAVNETTFTAWRDITLIVPQESIEEYRHTDIWNRFTSIRSEGESEEFTPIEFSINGYTFRTISPTECQIVGTVNMDCLIIPDTVSYGGKEFVTTSIKANAFSRNGGITGVVIPNTVTHIGGYAFKRCYFLKSITLPTSLKIIEGEAFMNCFSLESIEIPNSVTYIGNGAFNNCTSLAEVKLSNNLLKIEAYTFYGCESLTEITIPESIVSVGEYAFLGSNIETVNISNLKAWCEIDFKINCNPLSSRWIYGGGKLFLNGNEVTTLTIPEGLHQVKPYSFTYCSSLKSINLPPSVSEIQESAFNGCPNLENINFSDSLSNIAMGAFRYCYALKDLKLPSKLKIIGRNAFDGCTALTTVSIPPSVNTVGQSAFSDCSLESIVIPEGVESIGKGVFSNCERLKEITLPSSLRSIGEVGFAHCTNLEKIYISNPIPLNIAIESEVFYGDSHVTLYVPSGSKEAYESDVYWSTVGQIETWSVGGNVNFIDNGLQYHITSDVYSTIEVMKSTQSRSYSQDMHLIIPEIVEVNNNPYQVIGIANYGLQNSKLKIVEFPSTINYVGLNAFKGVNQLATIRCHAKLPPALDKSAFEEDVYFTATLEVPEDAIEIYRTHEIWGLFNIKTLSPMPSGIEGVDGDGVPAVRVEGGEIVISSDAEAEVYSLTGARVAVATGGRVSGLPRGVYLVRTGGKTYKLVL
ncbi:MAG: leucine-rich repeat protein [Barnesiella sp.]|nr:leucine-rich repeat protein [Barnesiella sp.]